MVDAPGPPPPTDEELFEQWKGGNTRAGHSLFKRHFDAVLRFFRRQLGDEAPDLVQDTFLGCVQARDQFDRRASFRTYLFAVARHHLFNEFRRRSRRPELDFHVTSVQDLALSPSRVAGEREALASIVDALRGIPIEQQLALYYYYLEDLPAPAVGLALGRISERAVRARLHRALKRLRTVLEDPARQQNPAAMATLRDWEESLPPLPPGEPESEPEEHEINTVELKL